MSTPHLPPAATSTRLDASQNALLSAPFDETQGMVYPSIYPLPGSTQPPSAVPPDAIPPTFPPSFVPGVYGMSYANYHPNYQGYGTIYPPAGFMPSMENAAPQINHANFQAPQYPFYDMSVGTATDAAALLSSEYTVDQEQAAQTAFQGEFPAQPQEAFVEQQDQYDVPYAQEDFAVEEPRREPGDVQGEDGQAQEESHAALAKPEHTSMSVHGCEKNPQSACSGRGRICLDVLCAFNMEHPGTFSPEQLSRGIMDAIAPVSNARQSAVGQPLRVDIDDSDVLLLSQYAMQKNASSGSSTTASTSASAHASPSGSSLSPPTHVAVVAPESNARPSTAGQPSQVAIDDSDLLLMSQHVVRWAMASSGSSTTASTSTSAHVSPGGSCLSPPNHVEATSSSLGAAGSPTGKYRHFEEYQVDRPKKRRRQCTDSQDAMGHSEQHPTPDGGEKRRKKRKPADGEFICLICEILGQPCLPLSRKDSLKRHILKLHAMFESLLQFEYRDFRILQPRHLDQLEDLRPLIIFCIAVQAEAREGGAEIEQDQDLAILYPEVLALVNDV